MNLKKVLISLVCVIAFVDYFNKPWLGSADSFNCPVDKAIDLFVVCKGEVILASDLISFRAMFFSGSAVFSSISVKYTVASWKYMAFG